MKSSVLWKKSAEDDLADLWLAATDREAIAHVSLEIDRCLEANPQSQGESRGGQRRILFVLGFVVTFEVYDADRIVRVLNIWRTRH